MNIYDLDTLSEEDLMERLMEINKKLYSTRYINASQNLIDTLYNLRDMIQLEIEVRSNEAMIKEFSEKMDDVIPADKGWGVKVEKVSKFSNTPRAENKPGTPKIFQKTFRNKPSA